MKFGMPVSLGKMIHIFTYTGFGAFLALLIVFVLFVNSKPELKSWHTTRLKNEFTVEANVQTLDEYRSLEDRLFAEMKERIVDKVPKDQKSTLSRFTINSRADPDRWPRNWNRTYVLEADRPTAGILMLHGLSDSPYSLQHLAHSLNQKGARIVGLRIPGHGTVPSGLLTVRWQDMAAAVQMAMQQLSDSLKDKPIYIVGYSNGATLAIHYALTALNRPDLPQPRRLVLLSPALAVTPLAALAVWQARLGHILGLRKLAWQAVLPEYDPYKYQSFAINAGDLSFRFTSEVQHLLVQHAEGDRTREFPPTLAFLSAVDATVSTRAVVDDFLMKLSPNHHELIVFDLNRSAGAEYLFQDDPSEEIERLLLHAALPFTYGVVRNRNSSAADVVLSINARDHAPVTNEELGMAWPRGVLSLSHVALPFPPEDPLYGGPDALQGFGLNLGNLALRGEKGAFKITAEDLLRQRWNPFYDLVEDRTIAFLLESE